MGVKDNLSNEPVSDLPLREAITVPGSAAVRTTIAQLREKRLGCAIVVDSTGKPIGTFTERSIISLLLDRPDALESQTVAENLDKTWAAVKLTDPVLSVVQAMQSKNSRFVVVTDEEGKAVALTGQKGIMEYVAEHFPDKVLVQRLGEKPSMAEREGA